LLKTVLTVGGNSALRATATGAELQAGNLAVYHNLGRVNISRPLTVGAPF